MDINQIYEKLVRAYPAHVKTILATMPVAHAGGVHTLKHCLTGKTVTYDETNGQVTGMVDGMRSVDGEQLFTDIRIIERAA